VGFLTDSGSLALDVLHNVLVSPDIAEFIICDEQLSFSLVSVTADATIIMGGRAQQTLTPGKYLLSPEGIITLHQSRSACTIFCPAPIMTMNRLAAPPRALTSSTPPTAMTDEVEEEIDSEDTGSRSCSSTCSDQTSDVSHRLIPSING
jgi:hypothetical protein